MAALPLVACLDATPIIVTRATPDAAPLTSTGDDASLDAGDAQAKMTCYQCLEAPDKPGPGCHDFTAPCEANQTCATAYRCAVTAGCLETPTVEEFLNCGIACANEAGVVSYTDPATQMTYQIFRCALSACKDYCRFAQGDAQAP
jgi:hypothetical protein